jgi:hypothetical protein
VELYWSATVAERAAEGERAEQTSSAADRKRKPVATLQAPARPIGRPLEQAFPVIADLYEPTPVI